MSTYPRATDDPLDDEGRRKAQRATDDELAERITRALRSREAARPDASVVAARIEARLAQGADGAPVRAEPPSATHLTHRSGRAVFAGVAVSVLTVAGAGAAAAANPYSNVARVVENVAQAVGIDWSAMPDGYTREQYEAFWGAGYTPDDVELLNALWNTDYTETKARAGQMILDGAPMPIPPDENASASSSPEADWSSMPGRYTREQYDAFWGAGYTPDDVELLDALWNSDYMETKARAGQMILDGEPMPIPPGEAADATDQ